MSDEISFTQNDIIYGNQIDNFLHTNSDINDSKNDVYYQMFPSIEKQIINTLIDEYGVDECLDIFLQLAEQNDIISNTTDNTIKNKTNNSDSNDMIANDIQNSNINGEYNTDTNEEYKLNNDENNLSRFSLSRLFRRNNKGNYKKINSDELLQIGDDDDL
jgi:hypothetical protein